MSLELFSFSGYNLLMRIEDYKNTKSGLTAVFSDRNKNETEIGKGGYDDCIDAISAFLKDTGRKSYYTRLVLLGDSLMIDFGSHSEFVYLRKI